jgi:hypothetical protein
VGEFTSIAKGSDNNPIISYYDISNSDLKVVKCNNTDCSNTTITTLDSTDEVGLYSSLVIGADGFPVISYYDLSNRILKIAKCLSIGCTNSPTISTIVDPFQPAFHDYGLYTSITIGTDNKPIISYYDQGNSEIKVLGCSVTDCSSVMNNTIISTGIFGVQSKIAIGNDNFPIISSFDTITKNLKLLKCSSVNCYTTNGGANPYLITTPDVLGFGDMAIGVDNNPVISSGGLYGDLTVFSCVDPVCRR